MQQMEVSGTHQARRGGGTIGRRISALVAMAVLIAVCLVTVISLYTNVTGNIAARKRLLEATGHVFAAAVADQVAANDQQEALRVLRAIQRIPDISYAALVDGQGRVIAALGSAVLLDQGFSVPDAGALHYLRSGSLPVASDIIKSGKRAGQVVLIADISDLRQQLISTLLGSLAAAAFSVVLAILAARPLRGRITRPIRSLTEAMQDIRLTGKYETQVPPDGDGEIAGLVDTFNAMIDDVRTRDLALDRHRQSLETTVAERTGELRAARDAAEAANQAKSSFLATMSHEIRTPLNGLMVMAELLAGAGLDQRLQRYAEVIVKSGQTLLTIINDILDLSKIEAGKLELECVPLDPAAMADDVTSLFWERAASSGLDLAARAAPGLPQAISGDPVRLNQILSNLVNNALKFTEKGQVLISVHFTGGQLIYRVTDSGTGIPRQQLDTLFEAFAQADQSITRKFGGTGLGLTISRRLAEAMGGGISVDSELGRGSSFTLAIPVSALVPPRILSKPPGQGLRAGLAFDGLASLSALGTALANAGYDVNLLKPGDTGQAVVFAAAGHIASLGLGGASRPAVICIASPGDGAAFRIIEAGEADDLLLLPFRQSDIRDLIQRLASGTLRGRAALSRGPQSEAPLTRFPGRHVLVADDNAVNREVIIEVLRRMDIAVETAVNGREAVAAWRRRKPDLIFMDCSMPDMDGFAATREIRAYEALDITGGHTPIVALTAHIAGSNADTWRNAGMEAYMTKPFTLRAIADCLESQFTGRPPAHVPDDFAADAGSAPVIDEAVIEELRKIGGSDSLYRRVLDLFAGRVPDALKTAEALSLGGDRAALADAVHALKSMCANIGARRAMDACHDLEKAARTGADLEAGPRMAMILRETRSALAAVDRLRAA